MKREIPAGKQTLKITHNCKSLLLADREHTKVVEIHKMMQKRTVWVKEKVLRLPTASNCFIHRLSSVRALAQQIELALTPPHGWNSAHRTKMNRLDGSRSPLLFQIYLLPRPLCKYSLGWLTAGIHSFINLRNLFSSQIYVL